MIDYQKVGSKIRDLRINKNLTQEEFSEEIGISVSYLGKIESGKRLASIKTLERTCEILNTPLSTVLFDLEDVEYISCIWNKKTENLSVEDKKTMLTVFEMILDMLNANRTE